MQANFHPEACSFSVLSGLTQLSNLTVLPSEASIGLTDSHVTSLAALGGLASLDFPGHARAFTGGWLDALWAALWWAVAMAHAMHCSCGLCGLHPALEHGRSCCCAAHWC